MTVMLINFQTSQYEGRNALAKDLNIPDSTSGPKLPLLVEVLKRSQGEATQGKAVSSSDVSFQLFCLKCINFCNHFYLQLTCGLFVIFLG